MVKFDHFINSIRDGKLCDNNMFILLEKSDDGTIKEVMHRGAWVLCDNGYIKWSNLMCSHKHTSNRKETRFSEWLESMRKDVECAFGILKQRW